MLQPMAPPARRLSVAPRPRSGRLAPQGHSHMPGPEHTVDRPTRHHTPAPRMRIQQAPLCRCPRLACLGQRQLARYRVAMDPAASCLVLWQPARRQPPFAAPSSRPQRHRCPWPHSAASLASPHTAATRAHGANRSVFLGIQCQLCPGPRPLHS
ncbi:hypothetical protein BCR44DRAFT_1437969 [Catenaria anguillulae PL171]|uniref:Uncharacterized protein n=1 Tax=Catenaria anguillulae PL171 TaxID=765915 RepID=A0A1Y2HGH5_9FUNG|nr:hypothetical protein BCR44DRAFT_1437969 [Catenaria anguillulae PL171]